MRQNHRFLALDSFRGICALSVVVYHMRLAGTFTELQFFRNADLFVEFFFVLSGFVLTHTYSSQISLSLRKFLTARTFRLFPLHLAMLGFFLILELGKLAASKHGLNFNTPPFTGPYDPKEIAPNAFLIQSWLPWTHYLSFNYPSWSISVEYYLYMIFGLVLLARPAIRKLIWISIAASASVCLLVGISVITTPALKGLSCFFCGASTYLLFSSGKRFDCSRTVGTVLELAALAVVFGVLVYQPSHRAFISTIAFCMTVFVFAGENGAISSALHNKLAQHLGKLSYSIYLTHAGLLFCVISVFLILEKITGKSLAPMVGDNRFLDTGSFIINNLVCVAVLLLVVSISSLTHKYIELRGQSLGKKLVANQSNSLDR